ncbi:hypothetical protein E1B28_000427 [Marasmius oreades]|uniref:Uncharacterized protein n=1 Tax=Marasmius oreades TaxID=181124 RepID=A0A9P7V1F9_9AGAR|nr:uncharacterized protein E1B28_000427 [Marasmius oreades]KAG7098482.1 hypothetical protein E1B28_000427 [Marasmius oreades]
MGRQLRPRKPRPSYGTVLDTHSEEEEVAQNKTRSKTRIEDEPEDVVMGYESGGSDFVPDRDQSKTKKSFKSAPGSKSQSEDGSDREEEEEEDEGEEDFVKRPLKLKGKGRAKANTKPTKKKSPQERKVRIVAHGNAMDPTAISQNSANSGPSHRQSASTTTGIRRYQKMYSLPTPSVHHRHRPVPLFNLPNSKVDRLISPPKLFEQPRTEETNGFTSNPKICDRVGKSWGYNVGPGPLWELVEDRSWFKEACKDESENKRTRPLVHEHISVKAGWRILNREQASPYLPADTTTSDGGQFNPPPPVVCSFGPFDSQTKIEVFMFDAFPMARYIPESKAHVFNPGAPAWGLDWCPIHEDDRRVRPTQYLAVAPFPSRQHSPEIGKKLQAGISSPGSVQIWSLSPTRQKEELAPKQKRKVNKGKGKAMDNVDADGDQVMNNTSEDDVDIGKMTCEMILCLDSGPVHALKWVPLPTNSSFVEKGPDRLGKLGLLSGTFEDGSFAIHVVPDPVDVRREAGKAPSDEPIFVHLPAPILKVELEAETSCWSFDWANSEVVAIGTTGGVIAVYDFSSALKAVENPDTPTLTSASHPHVMLPTHYITVHQCAIRALAWLRAPPQRYQVQAANKKRGKTHELPTEEDWDSPTVIASGGYDGMECMTDIREGRGVVMNRTRDVINTMTFAPYSGGPITIDHENIVKVYSASPMMLGRGHLLMEPQGPVWSIDASDYHPQLVVGSADGSCSTTNTLRSTRRDGPVPFLIHKIYHMDYNRNLQEFRMLEKFLSLETQEKPTSSIQKAQSKAKAKNKPLQPDWNTGAWPQEVGVQVATWNSSNGLSNAGLLASATGSGLCRVDYLWGRWMRDKCPYTDISSIRMEGMEMESSTDSESA